MSHFDRFNRGARAVLERAQEEAIPRDHRFMTIEHLVIGMIRERKGLAAKALQSLKLPVPALVLAIDYSLDHLKRPEAGDISLSPRFKRVLEFAVKEWESLGHEQIGTAHLLLGLCRDEEMAGNGILLNLGMDPELVRTEVLRLIQMRGPERNSLLLLFSMVDRYKSSATAARTVNRLLGRPGRK